MTPQAFLDTVAHLCDTMSALQAETSRALSEADKAVAAIYHEIELSHFNAYQGYLLARRLQTALAHRRDVKRRQEQLGALGPLLYAMRNRQGDCVKRLSRCEAKQAHYIEMTARPEQAPAIADSTLPQAESA